MGSNFVIDVEADGPVPGLYSMVCFGAVLVDSKADSMKTFYGRLQPITSQFDPKALSISGFTREQHTSFDPPQCVMIDFDQWIRANSSGRPIFFSDNPGFDFGFMNYYFHRYLGQNPFGWSSRRIGDLYCGMVKDSYARWKHLRKTAHDHNPVSDALGNAEALIAMKQMGLKLSI